MTRIDWSVLSGPRVSRRTLMGVALASGAIGYARQVGSALLRLDRGNGGALKPMRPAIQPGLAESAPCRPVSGGEPAWQAPRAATQQPVSLLTLR